MIPGGQEKGEGQAPATQDDARLQRAPERPGTQQDRGDRRLAGLTTGPLPTPFKQKWFGVRDAQIDVYQTVLRPIHGVWETDKQVRLR